MPTSGVEHAYEWCGMPTSGEEHAYEWCRTCLRVVQYMPANGAEHAYEWCGTCLRAVYNMPTSGAVHAYEWCGVCTAALESPTRRVLGDAIFIGKRCPYSRVQLLTSVEVQAWLMARTLRG